MGMTEHGAIRRAAAEPIEVNPPRHFDRSLLHRWEVVKPQSGEWPRVTIAPLCDPRLTRVIHPDAMADDDVTDPTEEFGVGYCQTCVAIHLGAS